MDNNEKIIINVVDGENEVINASEKTGHSHSSGSHHHSHHHSHGHHHHGSKKRSRNHKKEKAKHFFKRYKYRISNILIALLFIGILVIVGVSLDGKSNSDFESSGGKDDVILQTNSTLNIKIPFFDEDVVIAGTAVQVYMESEDDDAFDVYKDYAAMGRLDVGLPVTLSYEVTGIPGGYSVKSADVFVSENENMTPSVCYPFDENETSVDVYHLKVNTQYYYRITLEISNGSKTSVAGSFKTADTPRILSVDGVYNLRDIGNWKTADGKVIKQGLLYRSAELDGAVESKYTITPDGVNTMLTVLGIRTDMDLRYSSDNKNGTDALGAGVKHVYYGAPMYDGAFTSEGKAAIRKIFADLANKNNYPVLMHCTHGMDRTGTVCYLLEAILGVSEKDLMKEYQLSSFCHGEMWGLSKMNEFVGRLKSYDGVTIQEKAVNYLLSTGVTSAEIANIREIFLGK